MPTHTFGTGESCELRPVTELTMAHRDQVAELAAERTPLTADGDVDWAAIDAMPGGKSRWSARWTRYRRDLVIATALKSWTYDLPLPQISADGDPVNLESIGKAGPELASWIEPYVDCLTTAPDPKGATTSSSNGSSPAKASASRRG